MDLKLTDKHVLITGGTRGIGLACARLFLHEGARVTICGRTPAARDAALAALRPIAGPQRVHALLADLTDEAAAATMLDAAEAGHGPLDILVNSAGAARRRPHAELDPAAWRAAMEAKFQTYINVTDPAIKRMGGRGHGAIVNIVGMGGKFPSTIHIAGGAANAALMLAGAGLAAAYASQGVRVNTVNPTLTATERMEEGLAAQARQEAITIEEARQRAAQAMPLKRVATAEEVADVVVFLASERASYVSGAVINLDGASQPAVV